MDFFRLIQSLDDLIFEVVSWLLFYPLTLWRVISGPLTTMKAAEQNVGDEARQAFNDLVAPPLFLLLTLILLHAIELATVGESTLVTGDKGFQGLINSDTNLIIFRVLSYSLLPLIAAGRMVRARGVALGRDSLRQPFYAQCYLVSVFAIISGAAGYTIENRATFDDLAFFPVLIAAFAWLLAIESRWFAAELNVSIWRGIGEALLMIGQWLLVLLPILILLS